MKHLFSRRLTVSPHLGPSPRVRLLRKKDPSGNGVDPHRRVSHPARGDHAGERDRAGGGVAGGDAGDGRRKLLHAWRRHAFRCLTASPAVLRPSRRQRGVLCSTPLPRRRRTGGWMLPTNATVGSVAGRKCEMHRLVLGVMAMLAATRPAAGQLADHLLCHRARTPQSVSYEVDLDGVDSRFSARDCKVTGRLQLACVPVAKSSVRPTPPRPDITGAALDASYTCYKVRCRTSPTDGTVSDQFGADVPATRWRTELLCLPATVGGPTTTTTLPPTSCEDAVDGGQCNVGTCPPGLECRFTSGLDRPCGCIPPPPVECGNTALGACGTGICPDQQKCGTFGPGPSACRCVPESAPTPCGDAAAPACDGFCPSGQACLQLGSTCSCWFPLAPCGGFAGPPACQGECPDPQAPICRDVGGACSCTP